MAGSEPAADDRQRSGHVGVAVACVGQQAESSTGRAVDHGVPLEFFAHQVGERPYGGRHADAAADFREQHRALEGSVDQTVMAHRGRAVDEQQDGWIAAVGQDRTTPERAIRLGIGLKLHRLAKLEPRSPRVPRRPPHPLPWHEHTEQFVAEPVGRSGDPSPGGKVRVGAIGLSGFERIPLPLTFRRWSIRRVVSWCRRPLNWAWHLTQRAADTGPRTPGPQLGTTPCEPTAGASGSLRERTEFGRGQPLDSLAAIHGHEPFPRGQDPIPHDLPHRPLAGQNSVRIVSERRLAGGCRRDRTAARVERCKHLRQCPGCRRAIPPEFEDPKQKLDLPRLRQRLTTVVSVEDVVVGPDPRRRTGKPRSHPDLDPDVFDRVEQRHDPRQMGLRENPVQHGDRRMGGLVQSEATTQVGGELTQVRRVDRDDVGVPRERPGRARLSLTDGERGPTGRNPHEALELGPKLLCGCVSRGRSISLVVMCHRASPTVRSAERTAWRSGPGCTRWR